MKRIFSIEFLIELIIVGIMVVLFAYVSGFIIGKSANVNLPEVCATWNKHYVMEKTLFLTGVLVHLFCEISGINRSYCANYMKSLSM